MSIPEHRREFLASKNHEPEREVPSYDQELNAVARLGFASPRNISLITDFDDSLYDTTLALMEHINSVTGLALTITHLLEAGGRFDNIALLKDYAASIGTVATALMHELNTSLDLYLQMELFPETMELLGAFQEKAIPLIGGLTARPPEVLGVTYQILEADKIGPLPILSPPGVTTHNPAESKVNCLKDLLKLLPEGHHIYYLEDTVKVAMAIHNDEDLRDRVTVMVPIIERNRRFIPDLQALGIQHGTHRELVDMVNKLENH